MQLCAGRPENIEVGVSISNESRFKESMSSESGVNRRSFLKISGLAAAGAAMARDAEAAEYVPALGAASALMGTAKAADMESRLQLVNVLQGTNSTRVFSRGNTLPIAAVPFGMAHWTLQSDANTSWMFQSGERRFQGFRCTHQLSPWLGDYSYAVFLPFCGEVNPSPEARSSS